MNKLRPLIALAVAFTGSLVIALHDEDPKVLNIQAPYQGPGFQPGSSAAGTPLMGGSQDPPVSFPRQNVRLMSWITLAEMGGGSGNDCWGYVSPSGREYALMGTGVGTTVVEVTDPSSPAIIEMIAGAGSLWRDIKVYDHYAYAVSEGGGGIQVIDLDSVDQGIVTLVNTVTTGGTTSSHNVAINEDSGYLYRCGGSGNGLRIYNLSNPSNPQYVSSWGSRYVHDAQIVSYTSGPYAGREIAFVCSGFGNGGVQTRFEVLDVTDKSNIFTRSSVQYSDNAYSHQVWIDEQKEYAYLNDELDEGVRDTRTIVFDISNLDNTSEASNFTNGNPAIGHNLYMRGDLIFEANYRSGLRIFDASNRTSPVETAFFDTYPSGDRAEFNGLWSCYPFFPSGTVLGSDRERGLFILWVGDEPIAVDVPTGVPETIDPAGESLIVEVTENGPGELTGGSEILVYDTGSGPTTIPLVPLGSGQYRADLPATACGTTVYWYVSARSSNGFEWRYPHAAPMASGVSISSLSQSVVFQDDFESNQGWTLDSANDTGTEGLWQRVIPVGTAGAPSKDLSEPGDTAWVTGRLKDLDGGTTTLMSPIFDLTGTNEPYISYWSWFSCTQHNIGSSDTFRVYMSDDGGQSWVLTHLINQQHPEEEAGWFLHDVRVRDFVNVSNQVQIKFEARDRGGENIVEAAIDEFRVLDRPCSTCVNTNYCVTTPNSAGPGALMSYGGSTSLSADDLVLDVSGSVPGQHGIFFYGPDQTQSPFGDGSICVGPGALGLFRLEPAVLVDGSGNAGWMVDYSSPPASTGPGALIVGSTWNFQFWYRDPAGGPGGFNLTDGISLQFCP
ncbi:MAG: choice-of-anchor B domain-containing protein [Planctomycetota bacterium]|jgi:choice-of-anchor B domain-containing protein